ncbi:long-chain fatty acid transport protein [Ferrimonas sediminum]|uniref:Long-chain fatty acid transport protein n=1 Tax=Ferrimonas sediminum TaxID=718193 RepID=A0A1G8LBN2_9GAMM|nr:outer membrane protein transport protein [Ferrimonas sediminum]SDI52847.1 long-chain fatty acid transport protein [Ferrimonas sediminum]
MKTFNKTIIATALMAISTGSSAAGFLLNETSVSGLGRAFAGEGVAADDAAVLARNPAAMSLFDETAISIVGTYIDPGVDMQGVSGAADPSDLDIDGAAPTAFVPAAYLIMPLNDKVAIGFAGFSNFGLGTDFGSDYAAGSIAGKTEVMTMNLNASVSYRINEHWSLGLGANIIYGDAELKRYAGNMSDNPAMNPILPSYDTTLADMSGDGFGYGYNVGVMYELNDNHRFSVTYRSQVTVELEGQFQNDITTMVPIYSQALSATGGQAIDGTLDLELPDIFEFSGYHKVTDKLALHTTVMWTGWSVFEEIRGVADQDFNDGEVSISKGQTVLLKEENFEDAWRFGIGATYNVSPEFTLRTGIAYDETPVPESHRSISIPDSDRVWYSIGANYQLSDNANIDLAFSYIDGEQVEVNEDGYVLNSEGNAFLAGAQFNYSF